MNFWSFGDWGPKTATAWSGPLHPVPRFPGDPPLLDPVLYLHAALGGAIAALAVEREKLQQLDPEEAAGVVVRVVREGVAKGMHGLGTELGSYAEGLARIAGGLQK